MSNRQIAKPKKPVWQEIPFLVGLGLTALVFVSFGYSLFYLPTNTLGGTFESKWAYLIQASPNEIGDTLAGFAGSLAFVWLVVTVWLQATELREQRHEFERMANAQDEQVRLLLTQGEIFKQEQLERQQESKRKLVEEYVSGFCDLIRMFSNGQSTWDVVETSGKVRRHNFFLGYDIQQDNELLKKIAYFPPSMAEGVAKLQKAGVQFESGPSYEDFEHLYSRIHKAVIQLDQLSLDQQQRFKNYGLPEIHDWLSDILGHEFWKNLPAEGRVNE